MKAVNATIREFAADPRVSDDAEWEFFCECGCLALVPMTLAEFDEGDGVRAPGHGVPTVSASD